MAELVRQTFRVTVDVTITVNEIDEALIEREQKFFHDPAMATAPSTLQNIERDRSLLAAVLKAPHVLERALTRRVADSLESVCPEDTSLDALQTNDRAEAQMIEDVRELLPEEDFAYFQGSCEVGLFYDSTMYFQDAFTTEQHDFTVHELLDESQ